MTDKQRWSEFAGRLRNVGLNLFSSANIPVTDQGAADLKVLSLLLLARTLSNLKSTLILISENRIVEARVLARCCYENQYWVTGLIVDGDKFRTEMVNHEMRHKRNRIETIFKAQVGLDDEIENKMRIWMRDHKQWADAKTLDPQNVAMRQDYQSYIFYQLLSWDAHPSIETLNRYYVPQDENGEPGIDVEPTPVEDEIVGTLNLLCLPIIGVFIGVSELLGNKELPVEISLIADEYKKLTKETGKLESK